MDELRLEEDFWSRYERLDKIGRGSFGIVYLIRHITSKRLFALKLIDPNFKAQEREYLIYDYIRDSEISRGDEYTISSVQCYKAENKNVKPDPYTLDHPGQDRVLRIYDKFLLKRTNYNMLGISMKYIKGKTLDRLKDLDRKLVAKIGLQIFEGVAYLHSLNIAHCDIKLSNIIWNDETQSVTILDLAGACIYKPSKEYRIYDYRNGFGITRDFACPYVLKAYMRKIDTYFSLLIQGDIWCSSVVILMLFNKYPFPPKWYKEVEHSDIKDWYDFLLPSIHRLHKNTNDVGKLAIKGLDRTGKRPSAVEMVSYFSAL